MSIPRGRYSFHSHAGTQVEITNGGLTATRKSASFRFIAGSVLIGAQPLEDGKMFEVRIEQTEETWWGGSVKIGCTTSLPAGSVWLPGSLSCDENLNIFRMVKCYRHQVDERDIIFGDLAELLMDTVDTVGIARVGKKLKFYVNGNYQGTADYNLPPMVYPMVDLYGQCTRISIVSPGKLP